MSAAERYRRTLRAVLAYAALRWQVVPLNVARADGCSCERGPGCASPGKHPLVRWAERGGTTDPAVVRRWWGRWPWAGVAVLTGPERSGLFVLDVDPRHGGHDTLARLEAEHEGLPPTLAAATGGGGRHLVFRDPDGAKQGAGDLGPGLDTRSHGGLFVVAPSVHQSGNEYRWDNWGTPPAEVPAWLLERLRPPEPASRPAVALRVPRGSSRHARYVEAALDRAAEQVRSAAVGTRNGALYRSACGLGCLAGAGLVDVGTVAEVLLGAALAAGLSETESRDTILSGLRRGTAQPRELPA